MDRQTTLFFEIFDDLPRQGPGDSGSTRRALDLITAGSRIRSVLDLGCGTGAQTLTLARADPDCRIVAIDTHEPFIRELRRRATTAGVAGRVDARVGDMRAPDIGSDRFDVVWCEGAIYNVGVEAGLRAWREWLTPGGHVAFTEVCWARPDPPPECVAFWMEEYPAIGEAHALAGMVGACGYDLIGRFPLPREAWWDEYYAPLQQRTAAFRARHAGDAEAEGVAAAIQREIDMWTSYGEFYQYQFFVARMT